MKLYHNADIADLSAILENGLLPMSVTGNDRWDDRRRADNKTDVVYLFSSVGRQNSFTNYGICLIEVETDDAIVNRFEENDRNSKNYVEYTVAAVSADQIKRVYIPEIFRNEVMKYIEDASKIVWCRMRAETWCGVEASNELIEQFAKTAKISNDYFNYFRGISEKGEVIDLYNIRYE